MFAICFYCKVYGIQVLLNMRYNFIVREKKIMLWAWDREGVADHAYNLCTREGCGLRLYSSYSTVYACTLGVAPEPGFEATQSQVQTMSEKTEMARILMLVVCASLLSLGKLSVLVSMVLASESPTAQFI